MAMQKTKWTRSAWVVLVMLCACLGGPASAATAWVNGPANQYTSGDSINFSWSEDASGNTYVDYTTDPI